MSNYKKQKDKARERAIELEQEFGSRDFSYSELCDIYGELENLAHRFGLIKEFRENGIL